MKISDEPKHITKAEIVNTKFFDIPHGNDTNLIAFWKSLSKRAQILSALEVCHVGSTMYVVGGWLGETPPF